MFWIRFANSRYVDRVIRGHQRGWRAGIALLCLLSACKRHKGDSAALAGSGPGHGSKEQVAQASSQLKAPDPHARGAALKALLTSGSAEAVAPLLQVLAQGTPAEQAQAALGLGLLRDARALDPLIALAGSSNDDVLLQEVAWALGRFAPARTKAPLLALYNKAGFLRPAGERRREAAFSLASFGDTEGTQLLLERAWDDTQPILGPAAPGTFDKLDNVDSSLADLLVSRRECDAVDLILRSSLLPPVPGARGLWVNPDTLSALPQGCAAALRRSIERHAADVSQLRWYATREDLALLGRLARSKGPAASEARQTLRDLDAPLHVDESPTGAAQDLDPLDAAWPNRLWTDLLKRKAEHQYPMRRGLWGRFFQLELAQITGSSSDAGSYELDPKLPPEQLITFVLAANEPTLLALLGLARPQGPSLIERVLGRIRPQARLAGYLVSNLGWVLGRLDTATLLGLSRSSTPLMKRVALTALAWRQDPEARARIQQALLEPDPVAQVAVVEANREYRLSMPVAAFAPLLSSPNANVVAAALDAVARFGAPADAATLNLGPREAELSEPFDMIAVLAAIAPERAERRLRDALADPNASNRARAERWLTLAHPAPAAALESGLIFSALGDPQLGPARSALLAAASHVRAKDVWELLHRAESDPLRRGFVAALDQADNELQQASAQLLQKVVTEYAPDVSTRGLVAAHTTPLLKGLTADDEALAQGLVLWLSEDEQRAEQLAGELVRTARGAEISALLQEQSGGAVRDATRDAVTRTKQQDTLGWLLEPAADTTKPPALADGKAVLRTNLELGTYLSDVARPLIESSSGPELAALLPRLEQDPRSVETWLALAEISHASVPLPPVRAAVRAPDRGAALAAARYLTEHHEQEDWLAVLTTLCTMADPVYNDGRRALDVAAYSVAELSQGLRAERADVRACTLRLLARRSPATFSETLLEASRDGSPVVRQTAMQLALEHPNPELAARARELLEAGPALSLHPWLLAVWLKSAPADAVERLVSERPVLAAYLGHSELSELDPCSYWLSLAAVGHHALRESFAELAVQAFDIRGMGAYHCKMGNILALGWSGAEFLAHYEGATLHERYMLRYNLFSSELPLKPSYAPVLERLVPDALRFAAPDYRDVPALVARVLDMPAPIAKAQLERILQAPALPSWLRNRLSAVVQQLQPTKL